jgi:hypothetical protein
MATRGTRAIPPAWIKPQLAQLVKTAPDGTGWLHEIKLDGYRMHARLDADRVQILTRRGNIGPTNTPRSPKRSPSYQHKVPIWTASFAASCRMGELLST